MVPEPVGYQWQHMSKPHLQTGQIFLLHQMSWHEIDHKIQVYGEDGSDSFPGHMDLKLISTWKGYSATKHCNSHWKIEMVNSFVLLVEVYIKFISNDKGTCKLVPGRELNLFKSHLTFHKHIHIPRKLKYLFLTLLLAYISYTK
jgi:hypothetical protein